MGIMRKLFQNRMYFEVDCKIVGEIRPVYRRGLDQQLELVIVNDWWNLRGSKGGSLPLWWHSLHGNNRFLGCVVSDM